MKNILKYVFFASVAITTISCDHYLDVKPIGKVIPETLTDYRAVLTKGYSAYQAHKSLSALRTDELFLNEDNDNSFYYRDIFIWKDTNPDKLTNVFPYAGLYNRIFYTNVIINEASKKLASSPEKDQLIGEAYALRALTYFDLINLFAKPYNAATAATDKGVPLALEIDLEQAYVPESVAVIYKQIHSDKEEAKKLLNLDTQTAGINYRFSKVALYAMESRIYLYQKEWAKAIEAADKAMTYNNALANLNTKAVLPNLYNGPESILALEDTFINLLKGASFVSPALTGVYDKTNDLRFALYFQASGSKFKFKKGGDINQKCTFRTAELYLTKAEASAQLSDLPTARATLLTFIKNRYTATGFNQLSTSIAAMTQTQLLDFIAQERQREFVIEGQRWFDLRRTTQKQIIHTFNCENYTLLENDPRYTLPFPQEARLNNPEL
ncbi:SusD-like starch-binding protein associating with outer membrane [Flavobacterium araucananum]|uniref:RagB/SusD family nutrient uptake outer membrane protein n=1 Tax=Flavobacterium araucananum TaxID=946678 RepID=A0A227P4F1_9FLAO|nr:RagB/SusD family nutrient uptake outer membrane protein [Flavobacterium araucananum]OXG04403.1 RagB/SusD family nutrient uptake outer membrane protein [Flavobacterium araucananum]PWK01196.1 SusD-like starch-binding protein associating with outer membrane [Flavobacterium araucananum]